MEVGCGVIPVVCVLSGGPVPILNASSLDAITTVLFCSETVAEGAWVWFLGPESEGNC